MRTLFNVSLITHKQIEVLHWGRHDDALATFSTFAAKDPRCNRYWVRVRYGWQITHYPGLTNYPTNSKATDPLVWGWYNGLTNNLVEFDRLSNENA